MSGEEEVTLHWAYASTWKTGTLIGFGSQGACQLRPGSLPAPSATWREGGSVELENTGPSLQRNETASETKI